MKRHKWSQEDYVLLARNVEQYGLTVGCKKTAEEINSTIYTCYNHCSKFKIKSKVDLRKGIRNPEQEILIADFLKKEIENNPNNLQECFKKTANTFNLSSTSIEQRWYGVKTHSADYSKFPSCRHNIGHVYSIVSKKSTINGKNQDAPDLNDTKKLHWFVKLYYRLFKRKRR